jgi:hypothetical protein
MENAREQCRRRIRSGRAGAETDARRRRDVVVAPSFGRVAHRLGPLDLPFAQVTRQLVLAIPLLESHLHLALAQLRGTLELPVVAVSRPLQLALAKVTRALELLLTHALLLVAKALLLLANPLLLVANPELLFSGPLALEFGTELRLLLARPALVDQALNAQLSLPCALARARLAVVARIETGIARNDLGTRGNGKSPRDDHGEKSEAADADHDTLLA